MKSFHLMLLPDAVGQHKW